MHGFAGEEEHEKAEYVRLHHLDELPGLLA
jgi:hypothetical protein